MALAAGQEHTVSYAGQEIRFTLRRSTRRRTIGLTVRPDGAVSVAAPPWATLEQVLGYVRSKAGWVLRHQLRLASLAAPAARHSLAEGSRLPLLDGQLELRYSLPERPVPPHAVREGELLCIRGLPAADDADAAWRSAVVRVLEEWYRAEAQAFFTARAAHYAGELGLPAPRVGIGNPASRWGSCSSAGRLRFNWRLLLGPWRLADYVAAHEVAHLVELNHSLRFWRVVARLLPDYKARERELAALGPALELG
jgi:predicted metal-dependent hydrolase